MFKKQLLLLLFVIASCVQAGVYVVADLPQEVAGVIQEAQEIFSKKIAALNAQENADYIFQNTHYSPHLSLAFVSQEELPIQEVKQTFANLVEELRLIAGKHTHIDLSKNFEDAAIDYWPGKFEVDCGGSKKKNYLNVVLKATNNVAFANLAQDVSKTLEENYNIKQKFPFSTHITIGRICDKNDNPIDASLKQKLEAIVLNADERAMNANKLSIMVEALKLKGHDGSEEKFVLLKKD
jgi:hypothetical protein